MEIRSAKLEGRRSGGGSGRAENLKILKRALRQGKALTDDSPASAVHELRITCKKLRYMMEFFKSLYPAAEIDELTGALKELQDNLGDFQDYEVHRVELYEFAEEMAAAKDRPAANARLPSGSLRKALPGASGWRELILAGVSPGSPRKKT